MEDRPSSKVRLRRGNQWLRLMARRAVQHQAAPPTVGGSAGPVYCVHSRHMSLWWSAQRGTFCREGRWRRVE